jgi:hypothetical protein
VHRKHGVPSRLALLVEGQVQQLSFWKEFCLVDHTEYLQVDLKVLSFAQCLGVVGQWLLKSLCVFNVLKRKLVVEPQLLNFREFEDRPGGNYFLSS